MSQPSQAPGPLQSRLCGVPLVVAVVAVWLAFIIVMVVASSTEETQWIRLPFVFASVEAPAFAVPEPCLVWKCSVNGWRRRRPRRRPMSRTQRTVARSPR